MTVSEIQFTTISTTELPRWRELLHDVMGMEVVSELNFSGPYMEQLWGLQEGTQARGILLGKRGLPSGRVRLLSFDPPSEIVIRNGALPTDTGAVKIVDFVVMDFERARAALESHGFGWRALPQRYPLPLEAPTPEGHAWTMEGHVVAPDNVFLGVGNVQGLPRSLWAEAAESELFSEMVTTSFPVADLERSLQFYREVFGFEITDDMTLRSEELQRLVGLPPGAGLRMVFLGSPRSKSGKVGLLEYQGIQGRSLSQRMRPPNRGVILMTLQTDSLTALTRELIAHGAEVLCDPQELDMPPYGRIRAITSRAPDGLLFEFFERVR